MFVQHSDNKVAAIKFSSFTQRSKRSRTLKTCLCHQDFIYCQKHLEQAFFYVIFFTHIHLMRRLSSMVNIIAVITLLLTSSLHHCQQRIFKKNTNYSYAVESAFHQLYCLKFVFKIYTFSKSYAIKQKWMFFF